MIQVDNLTKKFGDFMAVDDVSFTVSDGEVFAFLGPNGAGKTTTVNQRPVNEFNVKVRFDPARYPELKDGISARIWVYVK